MFMLCLLSPPHRSLKRIQRMLGLARALQTCMHNFCTDVAQVALVGGGFRRSTAARNALSTCSAWLEVCNQACTISARVQRTRACRRRRKPPHRSETVEHMPGWCQLGKHACNFCTGATAGIAHLFQIWHAEALDLLVVGEAFGVGRAEIHACVISGEMRGFYTAWPRIGIHRCRK